MRRYSEKWEEKTRQECRWRPEKSCRLRKVLGFHLGGHKGKGAGDEGQ